MSSILLSGGKQKRKVVGKKKYIFLGKFDIHIQTEREMTREEGGGRFVSVDVLSLIIGQPSVIVFRRSPWRCARLVTTETPVAPSYPNKNRMISSNLIARTF